MVIRFIRPEDRRRSGGNGSGPGFGTDWADTEPAAFRSEAFAEDLRYEGTAGVSAAGRHGFAPASAPARVSRRRPGWAPAFAVALAAALGLVTID